MMERNDYPTPADFRDQATDIQDLDDGEMDQYARACKDYAGNLLGELGDVMEAVERVHRDFEHLGHAKTLGDQGQAFSDLSNSMHDLITWHPRFNIDTGVIENDEAGD